MKTTTKHTALLPLLPALLLCAAALAACNKPETPSQTEADVAAAQAEGARDIAKAENKMADEHNDHVVDAMKDQAPMSKGDMKEDVNNQHKVDMERAEAEYKIAKEKCDALAGDPKDACEKAAKVSYDSAKIAIDAMRDISKTEIKAQ